MFVFLAMRLNVEEWNDQHSRLEVQMKQAETDTEPNLGRPCFQKTLERPLFLTFTVVDNGGNCSANTYTSLKVN